MTNAPNTTINLVAVAQSQIAAQFEIALDAEFWFGEEESKSWTHEERCRRLADTLDDLWRTKGGVGEHPTSVRYRRAARA